MKHYPFRVIRRDEKGEWYTFGEYDSYDDARRAQYPFDDAKVQVYVDDYDRWITQYGPRLAPRKTNPVPGKRTFSTIDEVKDAVRAGQTVHWKNGAYTVVHNAKADQWLVGYNHGSPGANYVGLFYREGHPHSYKPEDFYAEVRKENPMSKSAFTPKSAIAKPTRGKNPGGTIPLLLDRRDSMIVHGVAPDVAFRETAEGWAATVTLTQLKRIARELKAGADPACANDNILARDFAEMVRAHSRGKNPDIHIDIGSHNTRGTNVRAKNPKRDPRLNAHNELKEDKRFTVTLEGTGHATPRYVARFAGKYLGDSHNVEGAIWLALNEKDARNKILEGRAKNPADKMTKPKFKAGDMVKVDFSNHVFYVAKAPRWEDGFMHDGKFVKGKWVYKLIDTDGATRDQYGQWIADANGHAREGRHYNESKGWKKVRAKGQPVNKVRSFHRPSNSKKVGYAEVPDGTGVATIMLAWMPNGKVLECTQYGYHEVPAMFTAASPSEAYRIAGTIDRYRNLRKTERKDNPRIPAAKTNKHFVHIPESEFGTVGPGLPKSATYIRNDQDSPGVMLTLPQIRKLIRYLVGMPSERVGIARLCAKEVLNESRAGTYASHTSREENPRIPRTRRNDMGKRGAYYIKIVKGSEVGYYTGKPMQDAGAFDTDKKKRRLFDSFAGAESFAKAHATPITRAGWRIEIHHDAYKGRK